MHAVCITVKNAPKKTTKTCDGCENINIGTDWKMLMFFEPNFEYVFLKLTLAFDPPPLFLSVRQINDS